MSGEATSIRVLHVDDDPEIGDLVALHLEAVDDQFDVVTESDPTAVLDRLADREFDCVVSDNDMPVMDGLDLLTAVREAYPALPFILFTGKGSEEIASEAISAGVTEYLQKGVGSDQYTVLANRIERAVGETRAKAALEESERRLSTLISNLPGMVYRARAESDVSMTFVSDGAAALTGYDATALESGATSWPTLIEADARDRRAAVVETCVAAEEAFEVTYPVETADGETRWLWERGRKVAETADGTAVLEGFVTDISARKERERELEREREFTEELLNAIDDAFVLLDPDGYLLRWNDTLAAVTGYDDEALRSMTVEDLFPAANLDGVASACDEALETGSIVLNVPLQTADGEEICYEFRGSRIPDTTGGVLGIAAIGRDVTERTRRDRQLEQYETLVESVGDPMYILDTEGVTQMANSGMAAFLGADQADIVGRPVEEFIGEAAVARGEAMIRELLETADRDWGTFEMEVERPDGTERLVEISVAILTDDGQLTGSVGVVRDVTERKARERRLREYRTLVESVGDPMYILDDVGTVQMANEAMAAHLGADRDDIVGADPLTFMPEADVERATDILTDLATAGRQTVTTFEMETIAVDGARTITEAKVAPLFEGDRYVGSVGVLRDISARKARERDLERFETIIEAVGDPVYALDAEGRFTYVNEAIGELTGYCPTDLIGEHIETVMTDADLSAGRAIIQQMLQAEERAAQSQAFEMDVVAKWGEHIPCENNIALLPQPEGAFTGTAGIIRDIAARKERERRLAEFASVVSHDLRSPLNVVQGRIELARETGDETHLDAAANASDRMEELIDDLLTLAREGELVSETAPVDLRGLAEQAWGNVDAPAATLDCVDTGLVEADSGRLREVFENLFSNSVEHGRPDVTVRLGTLSDDAGAVTGFFVADDGPGIPEEERERIFERGYTTSADGTGFGLAIVADIVEAHGWALSVAASEFGGARFEITTSPADR